MILKQKSDALGIAASSLCLVHCIATPFIFIALACSKSCCADTPVWWQAIDYLFLVVSFGAIYYAVKNTTKRWIQYALWGSWAILFLTILNDSFGVGLIPDGFVYVTALAIVGFHFYNLKFCRCSDDSLCAS